MAYSLEHKTLLSGTIALVGGGGTTDHSQLTNRDAANQHPMNAITGLNDALNGKGTYSKPSGGIPKTDLATAVQEELTKGSTAYNSLSGKEDKTNKVTTISAASTDTQYPSAKAVYTSLEDAKAKSQIVTIAVADWSGSTTCTKSVTGVTATSIVIVDTSDGNVECTAQGNGTLTFTATSTPTSAVTVKVVIL